MASERPAECMEREVMHGSEVTKSESLAAAASLEIKRHKIGCLHSLRQIGCCTWTSAATVLRSGTVWKAFRTVVQPAWALVLGPAWAETAPDGAIVMELPGAIPTAPAWFQAIMRRRVICSGLLGPA